MANLPWQEDDFERLKAQLPPVFRLASRAVPARIPNCVSATENPYNYMSYYAAHPIAAGDLITIAISTSSVPAGPTLEWWLELARIRDAVCTCAKCMGPDVMCGVKCARCADGVVMPTFTPPPPHECEQNWRTRRGAAARAAPRWSARRWRRSWRSRRTWRRARARALAHPRQLPIESIGKIAAVELQELRQLLWRADVELCGSHRIAHIAVRGMAMLQELLRDRDLKQTEGPSAADIVRLARYVPLLACTYGESHNAVLDLPPPHCADAPPPRCAMCLHDPCRGAQMYTAGSGSGSAPAAAEAAAMAAVVAAGALLKCSGCGLVAYCSRDCQR
ncbi:hypothetical protein JKP88DRAFT_280233 [Tribonema minus]|uniref:MYND-type domain-containing protein n=1 Tax=Tribonema minus TaxID=303371 RepID=A0A836CBK9_9STRA|nr:hypothetical protein JKP88DRAFT_280233 [Tribonema minus]